MGKVHSIQSLGTVDGPGVRFVVFLQGCPLRCGCCHNPDTWDYGGGNEMTAEEIVSKAVRYREYFGRDGGITLSGGEPLCQAEFCLDIFSLCHREGINTCLDTSGIILTDTVKALLCETDRVLLDIKYTSDEMYLEYVGCSVSAPLEFLSYLNEKNLPTTVRQVIIPTLNDSAVFAAALRDTVRRYGCVDKTELLPFRKICQAKYDGMGIPFRLGNLPEPTEQKMEELEKIINA